MENERIKKLLMEFNPSNKITDIFLRGKDFSDEEINLVEKAGYINLVETTSWGDRVYIINKDGELFKSI